MSHKNKTLSLLVAIMVCAACQSDTGTPPAANNGLGGRYIAPLPSPTPTYTVPKASAGDVGILLSGWASSGALSSLNDEDRLRNQQAENRATIAPLGQKVTWNNPDSGNGGSIIATRDGYDGNGAYYREFKQTLTVGGTQYQGTDKASQQPDGTWKLAK